MLKDNLILVELNEINFDVVDSYIKKGVSLPALEYIINSGMLITQAELEYENLEPWIQWPSVHTGKEYKDHKVFRLGDFVNSKEEQFFEKIERAGFKVGAISPMNASNRLKNPSYFIPDPWTQTKSDGTFFSKIISEAISQSVNDNSQNKLTLKTILSLALSFFVLIDPRNYFFMIKYAFSALNKPWRKALFLDIFLFEIHKSLWKKENPQFSTIFLNAGAHIQHHYFFNSPYVSSKKLKNPRWYISEKEDPILEMLIVYDKLIKDLLDHFDSELIIATGLSQKPYSETKFYYRLKNHESFLRKLGIKFTSVKPRMTRDFLISFSTEDEALLAKEKLESLSDEFNIKIFGEIDNRGKDIFVVLTYPFEIKPSMNIHSTDSKFNLYDEVVFVAIKNGEHQSKGFSYFSNGVLEFCPKQNSHVSKINKTVLNFFGIGN